MILEQAIQAQQANYDRLIKAGAPPTGNVGAGLEDVNGKPVEVYVVPVSIFNNVTRTVADATCMMYDDRYVIFLSSQLSTPVEYPSLINYWLSRKVVLHEYGHIRNGDVFEDNPEVILDRQIKALNKDPIAKRQLDEQEAMADGYAAHRLMAEARSAGEDDVATDLHRFIAVAGLPKP